MPVFLIPVLTAAVALNTVPPDDPDTIIASLRQVTRALNESLKQFRVDLDREIDLHDRGYRTKAGRRIPGADADLISGPADIAFPTVQKMFTARMMFSRKPGSEPAALLDADRIRSLIAETRGLIEGGNGVMRQLLVISAKELNSRDDAEMRGQQTGLVKARAAATDAARKAAAALPAGLPDTDSGDDTMDLTWNHAGAGLPVGKNDGRKAADPPRERPAPEVAVPANLEPGRRILLVREGFRRIVLTDSGLSDSEERRLFYQEQWEQRQGVTAVRRWAVAVNAVTGQHTLLRRYALREFPGDLEETYRSYGHDSYSPPNPPQTTDIAEATAEAIHAREELANAVQGFQTQMRHDAPDLDSDLPDPLRQSLFAIRGHLAHAVPFREAEEKLRLAVERAGSKANGLEALAAWTGGAALEGKSAMEAHNLADTLNRADREIEQTRSLERAALAALPPDAAGPEAQFPALKKNVIVRIKGAGSSADGRIARCKQEIWILSGREVRRTISLIEIETGSGHQMCASREVKIYPVRVGDTLESIFDENAAQ